MQNLNYVYFGTPEFAQTILQQLTQAQAQPELVICNPDRPVGRDQVITSPSTKVTAKEHGIGVYQPEKLDIESFEENVPRTQIAILAAYGKILPRDVIDYFPQGIIVVHPSILPKYRGPTPIRSAMLSGEVETGTTLFLMDEKMDHGPILSQKKLNVDDSIYYEDLQEDLANLSAELLLDSVPKYLSGDIEPESQDHNKATYTEFFKTDDAKVDYDNLIQALEGKDSTVAQDINRKIHALNPEPGTWTKTDERQVLGLPQNKRVKLLKSHIDKGVLVVEKVHVAGKKPRVV